MLVFLDIDGVMVPLKSWKSPELLGDGFPVFSNKATEILQDVITEESTVMLTTSHKSNYTIEEWKRIFAVRGIAIKTLDKLEDNIHHLNRKDELLNWFDNNPPDENFVIIDDDQSLQSLPGFLKKNLILTSSMIGLTDSHLEEINARVCGR